MSNSLTSGGLRSRLAGHFNACAGAALVAVAASSAGAEVITWNIGQSIPLNFDGLYIKIDSQQFISTAGSGLSGWDINPYGSTSLNWFASGTAPNPVTTYVRTQTTGGPSNLAPGTVVGPTSTFANSTTAVVTGTTTANGWQLNSVNYVGFRFHNNTLNQINYGYAAVQVGSSATTRSILSIAYENNGSSITIPVPSGPYDPCNPLNPSIGIGANQVALNQTTAGDLSLSGCGGTAFKANYFRFTPTASGTYTFDNCSSGAATRMAIMDGCTAGSAQLACNDNDCGSSSRVSASLTSGVTYYVVVGAESSSATLTSPMSIAVTPPPVPACTTAAAASYGDNEISSTANPGVNQTVFTTAAQATTGTSIIYNVQFFKFTPTATGAFTFKACSAGDTKMAIGTGCPLVGGTMSTIAYNDDAPTCPTGGTATTNFGSWIDATCNAATTCFGLAQDLVAGQTYYICVGGFGSTSAVAGSLNIDGPQGSTCRPDIDGDGIVGGLDLSAILAAWGSSNASADLDGDLDVDGADLTALLAAWGTNGCG
jgi:hypothetical protein